MGGERVEPPKIVATSGSGGNSDPPLRDIPQPPEAFCTTGPIGLWFDRAKRRAERRLAAAGNEPDATARNLPNHGHACAGGDTSRGGEATPMAQQ